MNKEPYNSTITCPICLSGQTKIVFSGSLFKEQRPF